MPTLPRKFPFRNIFNSFLEQYSSSSTYWYIQKTRVLNDENVSAISKIVEVIFDEFLGHIWNQETQGLILSRLVELNILSPTRPDGNRVDRTALIRIWKKLLETLGLLWVQDEAEIVITDVGLNLISEEGQNARTVIEGQIVKYQYPTPSLTGEYARNFIGILPHIFLLQILRRCDHQISFVEYELFVNLAKSQDDIDQIQQMILSWRDLNEREKEIIIEAVRNIPMSEAMPHPELPMDLPTDDRHIRFNRIHLDSSYQRSFFTFPYYLESTGSDIICSEPDIVDGLLDRILPSLKITEFRTLEDWFAYYGDPNKQPSWLTYLISAIENAQTAEEVQTVVEEHSDVLTEEEVKTVQNAQVEKDIETFYFAHPEMLEPGLTVIDNGRQYSTPIGRIDLLCQSQNGEYVVVEIKAYEAQDSVFGQILRYIGWLHRNNNEARNNVRGIILAAQFPESARYSRIGLLKEDYQSFLQFKRHGLDVQNS